MLITKNEDENFGIVRFQTNNTLNIRTEAFINKEEIKIIKAKFKVKTWTMLEIDIFRNFNSCYMTIEAESIMIIQKNLVKKLVLINIKNYAKK